ncbi:MAG: HAMP domain-containing histidine kinase [Acidobacteria bacterium]|nr:HAMP domain-containing histidine kinase [Acidobacteriota bacterium]
MWYRSLYWRIALGFIGGLALLLVVQAMLFVWMMSAAGSAVPNQPPDRLAQAVAVDVAQALERDATLDIERYVRQEYAKDTQPFFVVLADGRLFEVGARFPEPLKTEARARLDVLRTMEPERLARGGFGRGVPFRFGERRGGADGRPPQLGEMPPPGTPIPPGGDERPGFPRREDRLQGPGVSGPRGERVRDGGRAGPPAFRTGRPWPIVAHGTLAGLVIVPPQTPFTFLLTRYAPTLVTVAAVTLIVGGALAAFAIFGPARRRLKAVEDAARRLGSGDLSARAPMTGNDEVAAVASAFNAMADDLTARTEALVAADRARRQLLADVSHELNTPVTAMRGYLETLAMPELSLDEATRARYLAIVGDETARLERLIGDLLDLARLEGGGGALEMAPVKVADLFARVTARHERTAQDAHVIVDAVVEPGAETIVGDQTRLEQALQNLAANALRVAPAGSRVRLRARRDGERLIVTVADEGPGIPPEHLTRVFDRFYKADPSRAMQPGGAGGSGLGLSIVKAIVERHGGTVAVTSEPGRTEFRLHFTATQPEVGR